MNTISRSVVKKDHEPKIRGESVFVNDYTAAGDARPILTGKLLHASVARAKVLSVELPELPEGYCYVDARDVPGSNHVLMITWNDLPVFCDETVEYIGEAIGMVVGPDDQEVSRILGEIKVNYEPLDPVLDLREATEAVRERDFGYGDPEKAFAEADSVIEEEFETGYQEHAYLEPQGFMAEPEEDGKMFVHGSCQCAYSVQDAVVSVLGCKYRDVHVLQDVTGGGFGGKEAFPSLLASQVAVAAQKMKAPVRCVYDRKEDLAYSFKRHPSLCRYKMALKDGKVTAVDCDIRLNAGAYCTLSGLVLDRAAATAAGVYSFPNLHVHAAALKTNTVPNDAYRGFGGPQVIFAMERLMDHAAKTLGADEVAFRRQYLVKQGDRTVTEGRHHFPVPLPEMIDMLDAACGYWEKHAAYAKPQNGRFRRGIGMALARHGDGLTGTTERDLGFSIRLRKHPDGRVEVLAANAEIGQGTRTTFPKIVAHELGIPLEKVSYQHPDTGRVENSGPTSASRSLMIVGELLRRAAIRLREQWADGEEQEVRESYTEPDFVISFDLDKFRGDAFPTDSWSACAVEAEVDSFTGNTEILSAVGVFDVGTPVDENIVIGQMEGGFLQGLGYASMEQMAYDGTGRIRNNSFSDYLIPTAVDVPKLKTLLHVEEYPDGPYGAKGAGEMPLVGAAAAYAAAVEQALGTDKHRLNRLPITVEDVMKELYREEESDGHDSI